jgi:hypothetical protein
MGVVARVYVASLTQIGWATQVKMFHCPVDPDDPHAAEIAAFTAGEVGSVPGMTFEVSMVNELAASDFQLGEEYYISLDKIT